MKPIIKQEQQDTILTSEITDRHLVVAVINGKPRILGKGWNQGKYQLCFFAINDEMTIGNGVQYSNEQDTIKKMVEYVMSFSNTNIAVFTQSDWKAALKWLIDNA
jgi:hypothetical protein